MPQFESEPTLSVKYYQSGTYTYDELTLLSALPDASQIEVRWDVNTVYGGAGQTGIAYNVDDLDDAVQQEIKTLDLNTQFTIDPSADTVTIIPAAIEDQAIATSSGTFYYPSTFSITSSQFLEIRRATDITYRVVDFQPGSRLTSENLNLANSQVFNAIQELTEFGFGGQGGSITDIDLSNSSVTDLGDVTFNTGVTGLVQWNSATQQMENSGTAGGLVPNNEGASDTDGQVLLSSFTVGGPNASPSFDWEWLTTAEVFTNKAANTSLASVLTTIDLDLQTLDTRTSDMSRPSIPGPTIFGTDLEVGNDITVGGDVLIQGESVYDAITTKTYLQLSCSGIAINVGTGGDRNLQHSTIRSSLVKIASSDFVIDEVNDENILFPSAGVYKIDAHLLTSYGTPSSVGDLVRRRLDLLSTPSGGGTSIINPSFDLNESRDSGGSVGDKTLSGSWLLSVGANHTIQLSLANPGADNGIQLRGYTIIITKVS